jgi:hypothetical protein
MVDVSESNRGRERLLALAASLAGAPGVELGSGRGFGAGTLMVNGRILALSSGDRLVLKLPARRVTDLLAAGRGQPYTAGKERPLREWIAVGDDEDWLALAREALEFVRGRA